MITAGVVARINVSEHEGNVGRLVDVLGRYDHKRWIVSDGAPFIGYAPGTYVDEPIELRKRVEAPCTAIEAWKLQQVF